MDAVEDPIARAILHQNIYAFATAMNFPFLLRVEQAGEEQQFKNPDHQAMILRGVGTSGRNRLQRTHERFCYYALVVIFDNGVAALFFKSLQLGAIIRQNFGMFTGETVNEILAAWILPLQVLLINNSFPTLQSMHEAGHRTLLLGTKEIENIVTVVILMVI